MINFNLRVGVSIFIFGRTRYPIVNFCTFVRIRSSLILSTVVKVDVSLCRPLTHPVDVK